MAVVGSTEYHRFAGEKVRGRSYPWGLVQGIRLKQYIRQYITSGTSSICAVLTVLCFFAVENKDHCDFVLLKSMLINTHMQDLKDCTQDIHYENFRKKKLKQEHTYVLIQ